MPVRWEIRIAFLVAAGGLAWAVHAATRHFTSVADLQFPREAMYLSAAGVLVWLHARWRSAMNRV